MDLHDFEPGPLYFDDPIPDGVEGLLQAASEAYPAPEAEAFLRQAEQKAPEHFMVLVARYRYYYYSHHLDSALEVAARAMKKSARQLGLPEDYQSVEKSEFERAYRESPSLSRFYLQALKGYGYLALRLGNRKLGTDALQKLAGLDECDRMGARSLLSVVEAHDAPAPGLRLAVSS